MSARSVLETLRRGDMPGPAALGGFAAGLADGRVSDAQAGAFAMAVCMGPGLGEAGRVALTRAMTDSGARLAWDLAGPVVDKHSTGGVGDPVSLILAPVLAACWAFVPMISGRGLGHTGGTLDKLEAIPGLSVELGEARFREVVGACGAAIVAASAGIAPADRRLYGVRDATATVDQIDLITASILSKKLAAGLGALVLDVKVGSGAFMERMDAARVLAATLVETARGAGLPAAALITGMDEPLADAVGNAVELRVVLDVLTGARCGTPLEQVTCALAGQVLAMADLARDADGGEDMARRALESGAAAERFARMVAAMGGPADLLEATGRHLHDAPVIRDVAAPRAGHVARIDGRALGRAVVELGGGRAREDDVIDPAVGLDRIRRLGAPVGEGDPLMRVHARDAAAAERASVELLGAMEIADAPPDPAPLIRERLE